MIWSDMRQREVGEIVDTLAAWVLHPIRTYRQRRAEAARQAAWWAKFNAEVDAYVLANGHCARVWAEMAVAQRHYNTTARKLAHAFSAQTGFNGEEGG